MEDYISGIQQIGIGVKMRRRVLNITPRFFGMDALVFNDVSDALLMTRYTGDKVYKRRAMLSLNMQGGGGFEIWQFKNRQPAEPLLQPQYGDLGIYAAKLKCANVRTAHTALALNHQNAVSEILFDPKGDPYFWLKDSQQNVFNIVEGKQWFKKNNKAVGGVAGAVIGVSDINRSLSFYQSLLNIDAVVYDETFVVENAMGGGSSCYRKVLLHKQASAKGGFWKFIRFR